MAKLYTKNMDLFGRIGSWSYVCIEYKKFDADNELLSLSGHWADEAGQNYKS